MTLPASGMSENDRNNGNPSTRSVPPEKKPGFFRKYALYTWIAAAVLVIGGGTARYLLLTRLIIGTPFTGPTWTVKREVLRVTIVERGSLESAENADITVPSRRGPRPPPTLRPSSGSSMTVRRSKRAIPFAIWTIPATRTISRASETMPTPPNRPG